MRNGLLAIAAVLLPGCADPTAPGEADAGARAAATRAIGAAEGAVLYGRWCVACHGATGHGDGITASRLDPAPADLATGPARGRTDAEIDAVVAGGARGTGRAGVMPAFGGTLPPWKRRDLVTHVRALQRAAAAAAAAGAPGGPDTPD
jgi:high-affinity iron transporter